MAIKQLSVFVENKQGSLHDITDALAKANINLRSMCVADTSNYGIVRIIADQPEKAKELLDKEGHAANLRLVNAFAVPVFFMLSGYLIIRYDGNWKITVINRIKKIVFLYRI